MNGRIEELSIKRRRKMVELGLSIHNLDPKKWSNPEGSEQKNK